MIKRLPVILALLFVVAGCTDNVDTITREYRNTTNEVIDALMMVRDERTAATMMVRVFKPMVPRYQSIDDKLKIVETNRTKEEFIKEVFESDGFQLYLMDIEINKQRLALEVTRLRHLVKKYEEEERARLDEAGERDQDVLLVKVCPKLYDIVVAGQTLEVVRNQLTRPRLPEMTQQFPRWGEKIKKYPEYFEKFQKKSAVFRKGVFDDNGQMMIRLVN